MAGKPPTPHENYLQLPIPIIGELTPADSAWMLEAGRYEDALVSQVYVTPRWLCDMAAMQRDRARLDLAMSFAERAIQISLESCALVEAAEALSTQATVQTLRGNFNSARETLTRIPELMTGDDRLRVAAIHEEAVARLLHRAVGSSSFEFNEARERYMKALEYYRQLADPLGQIRAHLGLFDAISGDGEYFNALEHIDTGIQISSDIDDWRYLHRLLSSAAAAFRDQGYRQNLHELFELAISWSTYIGDIGQRVRTLSGHGELYRMAYAPPNPEGFAESIQTLEQSIDEALAAGLGPLAMEGQIALSEAYRKAGDVQNQQRWREKAEQWAIKGSFEGAGRVMDWNDLITSALHVAREARLSTRLEEAIEGSADPFFVFDRRDGSASSLSDLLNEFRNSAANRMIGVDPNEVRLLSDLIEVPEFSGLREPLMQVMLDRLPYEDEVGAKNRAGDFVWYARRAAPAGNGAVVTFRDITNSRNVREALKMAAERAHEADRAKTEFLANMSHEVRTPINGVLGLAQLLKELNLEPLARKYVDGIASSGAILLKVIGDVLDLSKIEARKMQVDPRPLSLSVVLDELVSLFAGRASSAGLKLDYQLEPGVPAMILTDGTILRQILANLVGNAIKFTKAGSVHVVAKSMGEQLLIEVADTGIGISSDRLKSIFEPFQRGGSDSDAIDGTGLGLTIARRLAELIGGEMDVTSVRGQGSRFYFTIPLVEAVADPISEPSASIDQADFAGCKVLLVEDNAVNVLVGEGMLARLGCTVDIAENGQEALYKLEEQTFDVVLMDIRMPVMDGLTATRILREMEADAGRHTPVIALTAGALQQERDAAFEAGVDDYLVKPFTSQGLYETLTRVLAACSLA